MIHYSIKGFLFVLREDRQEHAIGQDSSMDVFQCVWLNVCHIRRERRGVLTKCRKVYRKYKMEDKYVSSFCSPQKVEVVATTKWACVGNSKTRES